MPILRWGSKTVQEGKNRAVCAYRERSVKDLQERTYYELLGLEPDASTEQIREAYREIARIYHPDSNFYSDIIADDEAEPSDSEVFKSITVAYNTLVNEDKRREYDATLPSGLDDWDSNPEGSAFNQFGATHEQARPTKRKEQDIPEEWKREREYFEQHYEEILRPGPKVDLVGKEGENAFSGWEEEVTGTRFGELATEEELQAIQMTPQMRRVPRLKLTRIDPFMALAVIGIPIMFIVILIEIIFLH